jgi:hypothetical protein
MAYGKQDICGWKLISARGIKHPYPFILSPENGEGEVFLMIRGRKFTASLIEFETFLQML